MELTQNKFIVQIEKDGQLVDFTSNVFFPIKWTEILDEQLDEGVLTLVNCDTDIFKPLSRVEISLWNESTSNEVKEIVMLVSSDSAEEMPVGSGKFKHSLSIIEETKFLEGFICRSQGYVNPLGTVDGNLVVREAPYFYNTPIPGVGGEALIPKLQSVYTTPFDIANNLEVKTPFILYPDYVNGLINGIVIDGTTYKFNMDGSGDIRFDFRITTGLGDELVEYNTLYSYENGYWEIIEGDNIPIDYQIQIKSPITVYTRTEFYYKPTTDAAASYSVRVEATFYLETVNASAFKWNARNVIERALTICETIRKGETPRFKLNEAQAIEFEKIPTPEFQFTQSTLREILQGVGNYIHGEPRLKNGEIYYDIYGSDEVNDVDVEPYSSLSLSQDITQYATNLDSSTDNLINTIDEENGAMIEPYASGYKTLRTETVYTRVEDSNAQGIIETKYPIYEITKLECGFVYDSGISPPIDITAFVVEIHDYNRLSSFETVFPSKSTSIYYQQGQKNITGLFFKPENPISSIFEDYAIVNILKFASHNESVAVSKYPRLAFRVTYKPLISARVQQSKMNIREYDKPRTLAYNQGQNIVESNFYGENLKGAVARMGNVEKSITYVRYGLPKLPKVGTLFDDDYYISTMAVEYNPFTTKVSLGLTKEFNRLSEYVGINSMKRQYEVSERQAFDSHIAYRDYVVIGNEIDDDGTEDCLFDTYKITDIIKQNTITKKISLLLAQGENQDAYKHNKIALPVQALSIGNSAVFVAKYEDNYSAGNQATYQRSANRNVSGYWTQGVPYSDFFGNIEYLNLDYYEDGTEPQDEQEQRDIGSYLPAINGNEPLEGVGIPRISTGNKPLWIKKGSTEIPTIDYQIDFVSNRDKLVVGSQMAKNLPLISGSKQGNGAKLYLLPTRLKKFAYDVDLTNARLVRNYNNGGGVSVIGNKIIFESVPFTADGNEYNSWVMVSDVDGNTGKMLFGQNKHFNKNDSDILDGLYITCKHKLF